MNKYFLSFITIILCGTAFGGTLIYKGTDDEKKIISEIDIVAIDKNIMTFKIGKTTRNISLSKVFKYYNSDINMNLAFDDNTSDYTINVSDLKFPVNGKGITAKRGKKEEKVNVATLDYSISLKTKKKQKKVIKTPYFYLYLLTSAKKGSGKNIVTCCYPAEAKTKNSKVYNEAIMLEKAVSSERDIFNPHHRLHTSKHGNFTKVSFNLKEVGNREIIAYYLVVWGKDDIIYTKKEILNREYDISDNWHITNRTLK
ncbi:MAG: hypothetical protein IKA22_03945 [Lentisphaeria bacterium]|nr:hypothetical protein [Lentisphaeria bacterium]